MLRRDVDESASAKLEHESSNARTGGAHHFCQFFVSNLVFNSCTERIGLTEFVREGQERFGEAMFAIHRNQVSDDLLLIRYSSGEVMDKSFDQRVFVQVPEKIRARQALQLRVLHGDRRFATRT